MDPTRLVASTARVWGEAEMRELFGPDRARRERIASDRSADADTIRLGDRDLVVLDTPGHASHHVALVDSRTGAVFTGDALGIHVPDLPVLRPATPPPEFDLERYVASIERIVGPPRSILLFAHFGPLPDVDATCDLAIRRVRDWAGVVRGGRARRRRSRRARRAPRVRRARRHRDRRRGDPRPRDARGSAPTALQHPDERAGPRALLAEAASEERGADPETLS